MRLRGIIDGIGRRTKGQRLRSKEGEMEAVILAGNSLKKKVMKRVHACITCAHIAVACRFKE